LPAENEFNQARNSGTMIVGIILSAGESKRMGTPKQLLPWGKTIILQQVIENAQNSRLDKILLVLGSRADEIAAKIKVAPTTKIVTNQDYKEGMSSSVKCGVKNAPTETEAYMLLLGDQPFISPEIINTVLAGYKKSKHGIVIPVYDGKHGHPVIFNVKYKQELLAIGDRGAKVITEKHAGEIMEVTVNASEVLTDIDTPQDYQKAVDMAADRQKKDR
jgi:molybdenum cofactor cytidylyltransferase